MKFKTQFKWWYYNSLLSVFLIIHFQIWMKFTLEELLEIPLIKEGIEYEIEKLKKMYQENMVSYILELTPRTKQTMNGVTIWWHDLNGNIHKDETHIITPQYHFSKYKLVSWIC